MRKTQIQLPDALYERSKRFAEGREMSLAELIRRSLDQYLDRYAELKNPRAKWELPVVDAGGPITLSGDQLKDLLIAEESQRSLPH